MKIIRNPKTGCPTLLDPAGDMLAQAWNMDSLIRLAVREYGYIPTPLEVEGYL